MEDGMAWGGYRVMCGDGGDVQRYLVMLMLLCPSPPQFLKFVTFCYTKLVGVGFRLRWGWVHIGCSTAHLL